MHKAKNIYFLLIKKKRDGPRQGVAQGKVPSLVHFLSLTFSNERDKKNIRVYQ